MAKENCQSQSHRISVELPVQWGHSGLRLSMLVVILRSVFYGVEVSPGMLIFCAAVIEPASKCSQCLPLWVELWPPFQIHLCKLYIWVPPNVTVLGAKAFRGVIKLKLDPWVSANPVWLLFLCEEEPWTQQTQSNPTGVLLRRTVDTDTIEGRPIKMQGEQRLECWLLHLGLSVNNHEK